MSQDKIELEYIPLSELKRYPRNPKDHDLGAISEAIDSEVGFASPIIIDTTTGYIGAGHGRLDALSDLYRANPNKPPKRIIKDPKTGEWLVPCNKLAFEDEIQLLQFIIMDNKVGELGGWDDPLLADALTTLAGAGDGILDVTGFDGDDLDELLKTLEPPMPLPDTEPKMDKAKELQAQWQTARGQVWLVGGVHRVMCGDSTNGDDVARLMDGKRADCVITDPPYGVKMSKGFEGFGGFGKPIARRQYSDEWDDERPPKEAFDLMLTHTKEAIIFGGNFFADLLPVSTHWLVWDKLQTMPTFGDCELAWTSFDRKSVKKYTYQYNGLVGKEKERFHPTQKPVGLFVELVGDYTDEGATVLDLFLGSGTTLIACAQTGRVCYGMEIAPEYVAVILQRATDSGLECELLP